MDMIADKLAAMAIINACVFGAVVLGIIWVIIWGGEL